VIYVEGVPPDHVLEGLHRVTVRVRKCSAHSSSERPTARWDLDTYPLVPGLRIRYINTTDWENNPIEKKVTTTKITPPSDDVNIREDSSVGTGDMTSEKHSVFLFSDITHPEVIDCVESITALIIPLNSFTEDIVMSDPGGRELPKDWYLAIVGYPRRMEDPISGDLITGVDMSASYWHHSMNNRSVIDCNLAFLAIPGREVKVMNEYCGKQGLLIAGQCCTGSEHCIARLE